MGHQNMIQDQNQKTQLSVLLQIHNVYTGQQETIRTIAYLSQYMFTQILAKSPAAHFKVEGIEGIKAVQKVFINNILYLSCKQDKKNANMTKELFVCPNQYSTCISGLFTQDKGVLDLSYLIQTVVFMPLLFLQFYIKHPPSFKLHQAMQNTT